MCLGRQTTRHVIDGVEMLDAHERCLRAWLVVAHTRLPELATEVVPTKRERDRATCPFRLRELVKRRIVIDLHYTIEDVK